MDFIYAIMKNIPISYKEIEKVYRQIKHNLLHTPLQYSHRLSKISGAEVYFKQEYAQISGSFKLRGILSKLYTLKREDFTKQFVAASTGNHAAAFAHASRKFGFKGILFLPNNTGKAKLEAIEHYPIEKIFFGNSSMETEKKATEHANEIDGVLIHPYNDVEIIKGQGTIGIEIRQDLPDVDYILAPVGGGGLISGLSIYFSNDDSVNIIGCQPENASEMYDSVRLNKIVEPSTTPTISDATAGGIEDDALTYHICKKYIDGFELSSEEEIMKAIPFIIKYHQTLIEPSSALPVAALLNSNGKYKGKKVVLVLTGKKIDINLLKDILVKYSNYY
ncbi:MAG TPA: serine/threonine dehydratase [Bacteroidales bacterium]|nr:serine/threonine dehydratase [Bacteroidales bacterium]